MKVLLFVCLLLCTFQLMAQSNATDTTTVYRIETNDGNEYIGTIQSRDTESLTLKTVRLGEITLRMADIVSIETVLKNRIKTTCSGSIMHKLHAIFFNPMAMG